MIEPASHPLGAEAFADARLDPPVRGFLHRPSAPSGAGLVITHGAGGNCRGPLLVALAGTFSSAGFFVLRCDLPFRQNRSFGPPRPPEAARDRQGLKNAVHALHQFAKGKVFLGGHSYGGRQASMLVAEDPNLVSGLLLTSYPLHPPGKPERLRTEHLPQIRVPALFVEGTNDPFGTIEEITRAIKLIPAKTSLLPVEGAGHELGFKAKSRRDDLPAVVLDEFQKLMN